MRLRSAEPDDLPAFVALSREAGWPHRSEDWRAMTALGRGVAAVDDDGRVGGCAFWWAFGPDEGTVGLVIVAAALRGRGLGRALTERVLAEAGPRRLALNATPDGEPLYRRLGFRRAGTVGQHQGVAGALPAPADAGLVRPATAADRAAILSLDRAAGGCERGHLLDAVMALGTAYAVERQGRVAGFALARPFGRGTVAGPLVAPDDVAAAALLAPILERAHGGFLRLDTPTGDGEFAARLRDAGLERVDTAVAMVRGPDRPPPSGGVRLYGLAAQALG